MANKHPSSPPLKTHEDDHPVPAHVEGSQLVDPNAPAGQAQPVTADPGMKTIAEEQRERSAAMEAMGIEAWQAKGRIEEAPKQVEGVGFHQPEHK